ncbi:MAG: anhydro-N-acetylmuramic acid kinase [Weeksellaceae bacterium]|nr:anhydro-N-acetylmuramic acid kinase [Weeksellaceae bacterium]
MRFHAIGLMSGTSLDGLDICYASFEKNSNGIWNFEILTAETLPYAPRWEKRLRKAIEIMAEELFELHSEYGFYLGEKVQQFIKKNQIHQLEVIASHGHTVFHQPQKRFTVQIGDGRAIKILNSVPVAYDFRSGDVLLGGNGAPLVPIGDRLLFSEYDACLNLGGFSNISMEVEGQRMAFDICPVNIVLNFYAGKLRQKFDENGQLAASGIVNVKVLEKLDSLKFYSQPPPKSLGLEWVNKEVFPKLKGLKPEDALATFTEHAAEKIASVFISYGLKNVLITGGGAYNRYLIEKIKEKSASSVVIPENELVDFKEALIFAFMGLLRLHDEVNVLHSTTGSSTDHCSGLLV